MSEIKDYKCTYGSAGISEEVTAGLNLEFPDAYKHCDTMALLSEELKRYGQKPFCELPLCHTVEAEAMGGIINYGDEKVGPRTGGYRYDSLDGIMDIPPIDFTKGRIHEVLLACQTLRQKGEQVVLDVSGPFTILNCLVDVKHIFKGLRKQPEFMQELFWKLGQEAIRYIQEAKKYGVEMISYADSAGGVNILGPKLAEQVANDFTYRFLKQLDADVDPGMLIMLCPKTTFAMLGTGHAVFEDVQMKEGITYGEACLSVIGQTRFVGQTCMQNIGKSLPGGTLKVVKLI